jgi:hypothetical protein
MESFQDRLEADRYAADERVEIRALGREHSVPERLFTRMQNIAQAYEMRLLPTVDVYSTTRLSPEQCRGLTDELAFLRTVISDPLLDSHLTKLLAIADACARSPVPTDLTIEGP